MEKPVFAPSFFEELAADNPLGANISAAEAEAWWHFVAWPKYKTCRYRAHKRAVTRWWARLRPFELDLARQALARCEEEHAQFAQDALIDNSFDPNPAVRDAVAQMMQKMLRG